MSREAMLPFRVAAVVPAAGCGLRMAAVTPKQYLPVCGVPLVMHCLMALQEMLWVERVVVVVDDLNRMLQILRQHPLPKIFPIQGGGSRHRSIQSGVEALAQDPPDVVVVHDGVRPLVPQDVLAQVVRAAQHYGAAGAVRPLVSTVVKPDDKGFLQESLVRANYRNSEMPQAFHYAVLRDAYSRCSEEELEHGTECLALVLEHTGKAAKLVPGTPHLWKVTEEKDLIVAHAVVPRFTRRVAVVCHALHHAPTAPGAQLTTEAQTVAGKEETVSIENVSCQHYRHSDVQVDFDTSSSGVSFSPDRVADPEAGPSSARLKCDSQCLDVFASLEASLRADSKELHISDDFDATAKSSGVVIVITNLGSVAGLEDCVGRTAQHLNRNVSTVVFIFTVRINDCDLSLSNIAQLQSQIRDTFRGHSSNVTVILRSVSAVLSECPGDSLSQGPRQRSDRRSSRDTADESDATTVTQTSSGLVGQRQNECGRVVHVVSTLLNQSTGCFHGQVLVL